MKAQMQNRRARNRAPALEPQGAAPAHAWTAQSPKWPNVWLSSAQILSETMLARCAAQFPEMLHAASALANAIGEAARQPLEDVDWSALAYAAMDLADVAQRLGRNGANTVFWAEVLECADLLASAALHRSHDPEHILRAFARAARLSLHRSHCDAALLRNLPSQAGAQADFASPPT